MAYHENLKEQILLTATKLSHENGLLAVSVRKIADEMGIAVGTIYNYYPAKGDIVSDIVANFWQGAFQSIDFTRLNTAKIDSTSDCATANVDNFLNNLEIIYYKLLDYLGHFRANFLSELTLLPSSDKTIAREKEKQYFSIMQQLLTGALSHAPSADFSPDELMSLSKFVFENILIMLKNDIRDFALFKKILAKILK